jgi:hypothetical protein
MLQISGMGDDDDDKTRTIPMEALEARHCVAAVTLFTI